MTRNLTQEQMDDDWNKAATAAGHVVHYLRHTTTDAAQAAGALAISFAHLVKHFGEGNAEFAIEQHCRQIRGALQTLNEAQGPKQ